MTNSAAESPVSIYFLVAALYIWLFSSRENENRHAKNLFKKISITFSSLIFMVLSKDSKGVGPKYNSDPDLIKDKQSKSKTVIFVRWMLCATYPPNFSSDLNLYFHVLAGTGNLTGTMFSSE
jgi:hypothetical protein